jgi:protein TonB
MESQRRWLAGSSVVLHLVVLGLLLRVAAIHVEPQRLPGTTLGSKISLTYSPGRAQALTTVAALKPAPSKAPLKVKAKADAVPQTAASVNSPASTSADAAQGGDALGAGNATVALATFFPRPNPEIPHGTRGDVIIDVVIDEQGKVTQTQVAHSLGDAIDQTVVATVQTWIFTPATRNGVAVPSEQELLFHYERG